MTDQTIPVRTVHDSAGMLALIPGLVGFEPQESVVIVLMAGTRVRLTARVDTCEVARPELMAQLGTAVHQTASDKAFLAAYSTEDPDAAETALASLGEALTQAHDLDVLDAVVVGSEHWVSLADGRQHPLDEVRDHPLRVQEIYEGRCPARSRDELAALVQPGSDEVGEAFAVTAEAGLLALLAMGDEDVAGLAGEYLDVVWRERAVDDALAGALAALVSLDAGLLAALRRIDRDTAGDWRELWAAVVRRATGRLAYGSLVVAGTAAFVSGEGALLTTATEHAERLRGGHWGVEMLARINREVVNPSTWPQPLVEAGADVAV